jgi:uncharacterized iron-regulated membrane protein
MRRNLAMDMLLLVLTLGLTVTGVALWRNTDSSGHGIASRLRQHARRRAPWISVHRLLSLIFLGSAALHMLVGWDRLQLKIDRPWMRVED